MLFRSLSLERAENGKFVKADIFERPVSFAVESHANVGSPEEALSASLNKYGTVNLDYKMCIRDRLDAVRDGGIVAFITSQGVLNSTKTSVRNELFSQANLVLSLIHISGLFTN